MENDTQNPRIVVPRGPLLRSTVTFSDLSGGYSTVRRDYDVPPPPVAAAADDTTIPTAAAGALGAAPLRTYEIMDDPNSMAVFVVTPAIDGQYEAMLMISHRKLRTLFKNAIDWYLISKGMDPNEPRFYRLAQIDQENRSRANIQWRYMTFHLPDDLDTQAPLTRLLDRMDRKYVREGWAYIMRQLLYTAIICFVLFVLMFLILS